MKNKNIITTISIMGLALGSIALTGCTNNAISTKTEKNSTSSKDNTNKSSSSTSHSMKTNSSKEEKSSNQESHSSSAQSNSKSVQKSTSVSEAVVEQNITNFLNAAYVYSSDKTSEADRANIMRKYATTDVVTKIYPSAYHNNQKITNPVVTCTINGPLGIIRVKPNTYIVNFQYQAHNSNGFDGDKVNASYTMIVDNSGKIIAIPEMQTGLD